MSNDASQQSPGRIFRFFGGDAQARRKVLSPYLESGQLEMQEREKAGETLVFLGGVQARPAAANQILDNCQQLLQQACGASFYGVGEGNLFDAMIRALEDTRQLFVSAEPEACQMMNLRLENRLGVSGVYDFGNESCAHKRVGKQLEKAAAGAESPLAAVQARIRAACQRCTVDWAVACFVPNPAMPEERALAVGNPQGCWVYRMRPADETGHQPDVPSLWFADMLRRAALGLAQEPQVGWYPIENGMQEKPSGSKALLIALVVLVLAAGCIFGAAWYVTGGDPAQLWDWFWLLTEDGAALV